MWNYFLIEGCGWKLLSLPYLDECKFLILKVIEQSIRDFVALSHATVPTEQQYFITASGFLFDDDYRIDWGGQDKSLRELTEIIGLEQEWIRDKVLVTYEQKHRK